MNFMVGNTVQHVPLPVPQPGEILLRVVRAELLELPVGANETRFSFRHPIAKLFFFLLREGPLLTVAKVRASRLHRRIQSLRTVVIALCDDGEGGRCLAVGPQDYPHAGWMVFNAHFVACLPAPEDYARYVGYLRDYFRRDTDMLGQLFAYSALSGNDPPLRITLVLPDLKPCSVPTAPDTEKECEPSPQPNGESGHDLFLAGAGAYAYAYILPNLKGAKRHTLIDINPVLAAVMGERFGFAHRECSTSAAFSRLAKCKEPLLVIATYHSTHMAIAEEALTRNPRTKIFMEKPPVTDRTQLCRLLEMRSTGAFIEIGYNRRHAPMAVEASRLVRAKGKEPVVMTCIVKELALPKSHWYYWPSQGTRVTGNLCHWIDLGTAIIDASPAELTVISATGAMPGDELTVVVIYDDGSRLTLVATDQGNPLRGVQEQIDIRRGDLTVTIDDFVVMRVMEKGNISVKHSLIRDKGHARMYRDFLRRARSGTAPSYPDHDLLISTQIYLAVVEAARNGGGTVSLPLVSR
ncbi:hypothetical protein RW64_20755 [Geobacter sulfurreducens]|nr:hypothetical protein RW64_20755 [Geobacter sulfurreducens]